MSHMRTIHTLRWNVGCSMARSASPIPAGLNRRRILLAAGAAWGMSGIGNPLMRAAAAAEGQAAAISHLRRGVSARVLEPMDADYLAWSVSANTRFDSLLPLVTVLCESPMDIAYCLRWARENGIPLAVRGGGHNYIGMSSTNGLLIVTRMMRQIEVTPSGQATIQAGAVNGELLKVLYGGKWMLPIGTCPQVGVAGLTLGGGVGDNTRWAGLTSDHLISTQALDASGTRLLIDKNTNVDLFWACQGGGGGNFALHTELTFQLLPTPESIAYFSLEFAGADATKRAYAALDRILHTAPAEFSAFGFLRTSPRPGQPMRGPWRLDAASFPNMEVVGCYKGPRGELTDIIAPLVALKPVDQVVEVADFWQAQDWLAVPPGMRHAWADVNRYMGRALTEAEISEMVDILLSAPFGRPDRYAEFVLVGWAGGAVARKAPTETAYVHRNATTMLRAGVMWDFAVPITDQIPLNDWLDRAFTFLTRVGLSGSYVNWPSERIKDWTTAYYGENLTHLASIKRRYDPQNTFRSAQSIPLP